ncbi:Eco57I restriction-modification methylase domain-containing protein [Cupriavidus alkaliphilus]|uniref:Eco57I restriction-modification methylase domain-containing protein n=1 Tax=Cupriavidus alkaliphilus TaxID=942866 RepID=UPI00339D7E46
MRRRNAVTLEFDAIAIEGGLLPAEWLAKVAALQAPHQLATDYDIPKGLNLRDELGRYWRIAEAHWNDFAAARATAQDVRALTTRFFNSLLREVFGVVDVTSVSEPLVIAERRYPLTATGCSGRLPVVIATCDQRLDDRDRRFGDAGRQRSAFGLLQDYLNATDGALWGIASNGLALRLARDNASLTRPAWIEADLERIFIEERFADFSLLWLLIHASRFGNGDQLPHQCALEVWREKCREEGEPARNRLRAGVEDALRELGQGFLSEAANDLLRQRLASGELTSMAYFQQLLRLVYRLIFLLTIEERSLLHPQEAESEAIRLYAEGYSLRRLRERARRRRAWDRHVDLWQGLRPVFAGLATGQPLLALPALGGLFAADQCPDLDNAELGNSALLAAMFKLAWMHSGGSLTRINWRDMGPEELGSVYESLLELVPNIAADGRHFAFAGAAQSKGNARKTSGSYYTPDPLVQELLDSALEPVIQQRTAGATDPQATLLTITVCDPACGSGHFLLAAARRLANRLAQLRAQGTPSGDDYRHALRDVITHCIYGVDLNPMALELARMSLWLEAMTPDKPLGFLDHHLQCGDALLGVLDPAILDAGLPDDAFAPLAGDDKAVASAAKKQNRQERESWQRALATGDLFRTERLAAGTGAVEQLADDDLAAVAAKDAAWQHARHAAQGSRLARLADLYVGAFLLRKIGEQAASLPSSRHLWAVANDEADDSLVMVEIAARAACASARVLHWWLAFPQIAETGGFTVMLGNPPWEVSQLGEEEFFAARAPGIAALSGEHRKRAILALEEENPRLWQDYQDEKRRFDATNLFYRGSGRYPLAAVGKINTYRLFAEAFLQGVSPLGRAGFIVPTGIATDDTAKDYFGHVAGSGKLVSLLDFENSDGVFPGVHRSYKFCLLTLGRANAARFVFFATEVMHLADPRRQFALTPEEFALINPNTRTCPVFRSQRDAELTKKLYRQAPVLIREAVKNEVGEVLEPEVNPWGIRFSQGLFNMTSDSALFIEPKPPVLPLYEAKLIHQFDHRWATFIPTPNVAPADWPSRDCTEEEHADPDYRPTTRYFVSQNEVLAQIARVSRAVAKCWLAAHQQTEADDCREAQQALWLPLAQWIAGELFRREAGAPQPDASYTNAQKLQAAQPVEQRIAADYPACATALSEARATGKKAVTEFAKWAEQDSDSPLSDEELAILQRFAAQPYSQSRDRDLHAELDVWMGRRSPRWLMGWRDICRSTDERTVIASVIPRAGVGHTMPLWSSPESPRNQAALLGCLNSIVLDYVARQKVGGTHLTYGYIKQFSVLPPDRFTEADFAFIVPRVLELTYTAHDLADWAAELGYGGPPFPWNPERRALLRAELDEYYARLYGLTEDELRYILDPADVMGEDYPSETFRVLKNSELRQFGEYRTQALVLKAWEAMKVADTQPQRSAPPLPPRTPRRAIPHPHYLPAAVPCCEAEDWLAGLVCDVVIHGGSMSEQTLRMALVTDVATGEHANEQSQWLSQERLERLPLVMRWLRNLFHIPPGHDFAVSPDSDLSQILGDERTRILAATKCDAFRAQREFLAALPEGTNREDADQQDAEGSERRTNMR